MNFVLIGFLGLPHAHLLVTLAHGHKLSTPELLDSVLSAEIPDPDHEADLYELVKAHMIHGMFKQLRIAHNLCNRPRTGPQTRALNLARAYMLRQVENSHLVLSPSGACASRCRSGHGPRARLYDF